MFKRIKYSDLNSRQKENYNFQKTAAVLAEYGYNCMRLSDDWEGADLIAVHIDGETLLRVQLKGRFMFDEKYRRKDIFIAFWARNNDCEDCYMYPHDKVLEKVLEQGRIRETQSWKDGHYSWPSLPKWARELLSEYRIFEPGNPAAHESMGAN